MNIDDILDKYEIILKEDVRKYESADLIEKINSTYPDAKTYFKQAIKEIVQETLRMAAEDARMNFHDGQFKEDKPLTYFQLGVNNLQIDKDSITNVINKIKF